MQIAVLSLPQDRIAGRLVAKLNSTLPACAVLLEFGPHQDKSTVLSDTAVVWAGCDVGTLDKVLVRGWSYTDPVLPAAAGSETDWALWRIEHLADQQRFSAESSMLMELERRGVSVINSHRSRLIDFAKANQLMRLRRSATPIPDLLVTNDLHATRAFRMRAPGVLWRRVTGRSAWQRFTERQEEVLVGSDRPPIILAEAAAGEWLRAWVLDGTPLLCLRCHAPRTWPVEDLTDVHPFSASGREAFGELYRFELLETFEVVPEREIGIDWRAVGAAVEARWFQVLCAQGPAGIRVYDVDTDPRLVDLPEPLAEYLVDTLALRLCGMEGNTVAPPAYGTLMERPAVFLRRMMQLLYDMEASKYPEEPPG